jgi:hypothetical protein
MQYHIGVKRPRSKWGSAGMAVMALALVTALSLTVRQAGASGATFVVDDDGLATAHNCNSSTATPYITVSAAITAAAAGDTVKVCPGAYTEDVLVDKELRLKGAKHDVSVRHRTFASPNESTITGQVTIEAEEVKFEGFSLTNPGEGLGVLVKAVANEATVKKNIINGVGGPSFANHSVGVYLELGPDDVSVTGNRITNIESNNPGGSPGTAQGILVGDSTSNDPSLNTKIDGNRISDITSATRGAYGVQLNNGAGAGTGYTEAVVRGNRISNLSGNWVHAIGLEGETPNVEVGYNVISDLTDVNPVPLADVVGVFFESNPFFFTAQVNRNNLDVGDNAGIAVHPALTAVYTSLSVDGECNFWGESNGPGAVATGDGSLVSAGVDYRPWLKSDNLNRGCDHKDHDRWNDHDHWDWKDHDWDD